MQHLILFLWGPPWGGMWALCRTVTVRQTQQEERWWKPSEQSVPIALAQGSGNASVPSSLALCRNQRCVTYQDQEGKCDVSIIFL